MAEENRPEKRSPGDRGVDRLEDRLLTSLAKLTWNDGDGVSRERRGRRGDGSSEVAGRRPAVPVSIEIGRVLLDAAAIDELVVELARTRPGKNGDSILDNSVIAGRLALYAEFANDPEPCRLASVTEF